MDKFVFKKARVDGIATPLPALELPVPGTSASNNLDLSSNKKIVGKGRSFQKSWLTKYSWLDYVVQTDKAFCKVCKEAETKGLIKFTLKKEDAFTSAGFSNWKRALEKFRIHETTNVHKEGVLKLSTFSNSSVASQLNEQMNNDMKKSRLALTAIFTTLKLLCRQGLAIRGHEDINSNFLQLLELRKEDVPELKDWLNRSGYKWTSHDIQNEIIDLLGQSVLRSILAKIKKCEHFSIMVDETCDVSIHEQVSFCIRTVNDDLSINEDFIGLYETTNTESQTLFAIVQDILLRLDMSMEKLRGQCYDGASNMSGKFNGLQKLISNVQDKAIYVHCTAHSLNLAVEDSLRYLTYMRDIMSLAKDLINNVRESPKRMEIFRSVSRAKNTSLNDKVGLRPLCPTRWTLRASSVQQLLNNYENILELFETISSSDKNDAGYKCAGCLESMLTFKTYFFLQLYCHVMNPVEDINRKVQSPDLGVTDLEDMFINLACILEEKRGGFEDFWTFCLKVKPPSVGEPELARKRRVPQRYENKEAGPPHIFNTPVEFFKMIYIETCETVKSCVTSRFDSTGLLKVIAVERECLSILSKGQKSDMTRSKEFFQNDLDTDRLLLHLSMLSDISKQKKLQLETLHDVREFFVLEPSVKNMLPELVKGLKLLQVVPVTSATNERSFSALRRLKTYLRATMGQKRLNNLAITHAHQDILDEIDIRPVINDFIKINPVRRSCFALF